ncbi:hypothetical protein PYCCODRAFT_1472195 [Trametes coccinea BRFM310]|uniref:Uncharacterized protein n=1 Tax=Trametes coccinea (strain BRFM310) TaxID=1353009 RepID=A0A1Y2I720_TRAC3|nr:hypothetical protein PYCCODRAFT_1472195 [Trametes coccinea BRFM310]
MSPASDRPRRTKANVHPGEPVLKLKIPRRSPAEVAQERAAAEAQRREILKRREDDMRALAELEARLKQQDQVAAEDAARPPSQNAVAEISTQRTSADNRHSRLGPSGRDASPVAGATAELQSAASVQKAEPNIHAKLKAAAGTGTKVSLGRMKKSTRADYEAYRAHLQYGKSAMQSGTPGGARASQQADPAGHPPVVSEIPATRKRKASENGLAGDQTETGLAGTGSESKASSSASLASGPPAAKKGKRTVPGSLTRPESAHAGPIARTASTLMNIAPTTSAAITPGSARGASRSSTAVEAPDEPPAVCVHPGGYLDDETAEQLDEDRQDLEPCVLNANGEQALPTGGSERCTAQGVVQVEVLDPSRLQPASKDIPLPPPFDPALGIVTRTSSNWQMKDLQPVLGPFIGRFGLQFIPKLINLVGNQANGPWQLYGLNLPRAMEDLARQVWPELKGLLVEARQPFYELAKQKLSDYRNDVASKAIEVVGEFMYGEVVDTPGGQKRSGIYQGKLIVKTLAYHIKRIQMRADQVERALKMWETGEFTPPVPRSEESKFSDKLWGPVASDYLKSIINLSDVQWEKILRLAELHYRGLIEDSDAEDSEDDRGDYDARNATATSGRGGWVSEEDDDEDDSSLSPLVPETTRDLQSEEEDTDVQLRAE